MNEFNVKLGASISAYAATAGTTQPSRVAERSERFEGIWLTCSRRCWTPSALRSPLMSQNCTLVPTEYNKAA